MNYITEGFEPSNVLKIFEDICAIPHGSGNEGGVADYIENYARERGLFCLRDKLNNVFIRKDATVGYENIPAILFQGHTDMVCEKNADSDHDFLTDGLKLSIKDGKYLWADGTTLGGDDGIAVAFMLALLDRAEHPTLEMLFTVEEETGLGGAIGFDCSPITAKRMINLDSEEEWQVTAGCAGGNRTEITFTLDRDKLEDGESVLKISLTGLAGGHSGVDINTGKSNAIVLMGRLLAVASAKTSIRLISLNGGGKDNAIARECFATFAVKDDKDAAYAIAAEVIEIKKELSADDGGFLVKIDYVESDEGAISVEATENIISFMNCARTGVLKMSNDIKGLVEYSRNLGVAKTDSDKLCLTFSARSSLEAQLDMAVREMNMLSALVGADCRHYARYPGWEYQPVSPLRELYLDAYEKRFGKRLEVCVIHAGLECGILSSKMPGIDAISVGPTMFDIHSPDEHLDLESVLNVWQVVCDIIEKK